MAYIEKKPLCAWLENMGVSDFIIRRIESETHFPAVDVVGVKHGKWEEYLSDKDDYNHHRCSVCKEDAFFEYKYEPQYDEGYDGEWYYVGDEIRDMHEYLSPYCPNCGARMDGTLKERSNT